MAAAIQPGRTLRELSLNTALARCNEMAQFEVGAALAAAIIESLLAGVFIPLKNE
jgi:hypothetical protein